MEGRLFSLIGLIFWILILAGIFAVARITPWRPLRIVVNGIGILLVAITLWNLVALEDFAAARLWSAKSPSRRNFGCIRSATNTLT
jgi:hypothetical protein